MSANVRSRDPIDLIVTGDWVVTMNPSREMIRDGAVLTSAGRIVSVEGAAQAVRSHPGSAVIGGPGRIVTPGFINCHQHLTGDRLLASAIPDDLAPGMAIAEWAVPAHAQHTVGDDEISATVACIAALRNGITCTVEAGTVAHPEAVAGAMVATGMRGSVGTWGWDVDGQPFAAPTDEVLERQRDVLERWPKGGLVEGRVTLVGHDLMSDELLVGASDLARTGGAGLTFHISPSDSDPASYLERTGSRPLVHFDSLGVLGDHLLLAHAVHLDDAEVDLVVDSETAVAYTPWAYLRLGQGVARAGRHAEMWLRGARIGLGCDSENAGDAVDGLRAAALAAGLAKEQLADPTAFGAHQAFEMLTVGGAEAIGASRELGSIEPGKRADLVVHSTAGTAWQPPSGDPILQLVWGAGSAGVSDVIVDGRVVVSDRTCLTVDEPAWFEAASRAAAELMKRAGIEVQPRWPVVRGDPARD